MERAQGNVVAKVEERIVNSEQFLIQKGMAPMDAQNALKPVTIKLRQLKDIVSGLRDDIRKCDAFIGEIEFHLRTLITSKVWEKAAKVAPIGIGEGPSNRPAGAPSRAAIRNAIEGGGPSNRPGGGRNRVAMQIKLLRILNVNEFIRISKDIRGKVDLVEINEVIKTFNEKVSVKNAALEKAKLLGRIAAPMKLKVAQWKKEEVGTLNGRYFLSEEEMTADFRPFLKLMFWKHIIPILQSTRGVDIIESNHKKFISLPEIEEIDLL